MIVAVENYERMQHAELIPHHTFDELFKAVEFIQDMLNQLAERERISITFSLVGSAVVDYTTMPFTGEIMVREWQVEHGGKVVGA